MAIHRQDTEIRSSSNLVATLVITYTAPLFPETLKPQGKINQELFQNRTVSKSKKIRKSGSGHGIPFTIQESQNDHPPPPSKKKIIVL